MTMLQPDKLDALAGEAIDLEAWQAHMRERFRDNAS
jgi:hypothetical protein